MEEVNIEYIENKSCCVYMHVNKTNGKRYIGWTSQIPEDRWGSNGCKYDKKYHPAFYCAIKKYGWDGFEHIIVQDGLEETEAKLLEVELIALYKTNISQWGKDAMGYNMTNGGDGCSGYKHTEESRQKMSEAHIGMSPSEETRRKISNKLKGKEVSDETRRKLSEKTKKQMTEEHIQYLREKSNIGVLQYLRNGEFICAFDSLTDAANKTGVCLSSICNCCRYKTITAGGFIWRYQDSPLSDDEILELKKQNKHPGVSLRKNTNKWQAYIIVNGKMINLGTYDNQNDAIEARKQAEYKNNCR